MIWICTQLINIGFGKGSVNLLLKLIQPVV